jgi:hypothetical protein
VFIEVHLESFLYTQGRAGLRLIYKIDYLPYTL